MIAGNDFLADCALEAGRRTRPGPGHPDLHRRPTSPRPAAGPAAVRASTWSGSARRARWPASTRSGRSGSGSAARSPGVRLRMICDRFLRFDSLPVVDVPWSEATEAADVAAADVGISWIPDDLWSRGKCGLKVLQYQAAGLPVVANPVGVHPEMIRPGVDGFLASTPDEWVEAVRTAGRRPRPPAADGPGGPGLGRGELFGRGLVAGVRRGGRRGRGPWPACERRPSRARGDWGRRPSRGLDGRGEVRPRRPAAIPGPLLNRPGDRPDDVRDGPMAGRSPGPATRHEDDPHARPRTNTLASGTENGPRPACSSPRRGTGRRPTTRAGGSGPTGPRPCSATAGSRSTSGSGSGRLTTVKRGPHRVVYRADLAEGSVYVKHFLVPNFRAKARQWFRSGKGRNEGRRAAKLEAIGVPTITPVALGERRVRRFLLENYLVTKEIPDTFPLDEFVERRLPLMPPHRQGQAPPRPGPGPRRPHRPAPRRRVRPPGLPPRQPPDPDRAPTTRSAWR